MKKIISALALILILMSACTGNETRLILDEVESYISERPDSALTVLRSMLSDNINGREDNAKYALLYSMALDKNTIDVTSDSLISIATKWYANHGSLDECLKAYYYHGRVLQNARDNERAMEYFVEAEAFADKASDDYTKGLLYNAMANVYMDILDTQKAYDAYVLANRYFRESGNLNNYCKSLLSIARYKSANQNYDGARSDLEEVKSFWNNLSPDLKVIYYKQAFFLNSCISDSEQIFFDLQEYIDGVSPKFIDWLNVSEAYYHIKDYQSALDALHKYELADVNYKQNPVYHICAYELYEALNLPSEALASYKNYHEIVDTTTSGIVNQDTRYIKERYESEITIIRKQKTNLLIILCSLIAAAFAAGIIYLISGKLRKAEKERQRFLEECSYLESERDSLKEVMDSSCIVDKEAQKIISARLDLLNQFFSSSIQSNSMKERAASREFDNLVDNTDKFLQDTRMVFTGIYPKFIDYLKGKGLTDSQLEICCLYALGLSGKDVINYTRRKRHYIENMDIRSKLGLEERGQNLGGYILNLMKQFR